MSLQTAFWVTLRTALQMQSDLGHVPAAEFVDAKNGVDFPFTNQQLVYDIALYE
jgi:hypothetical protein